MFSVRSVLLLFAVCCLAGHAQPSPAGAIAPELARYLQLTPSQASRIIQVLADWNSALQSKMSETDQIRSQIKAEIEKDRPDPSILGGYYLQLHTVCRQATTSRADVIQRTRAALTNDQLTRVQALDDALALMPRVVEAQRVLLVADSIDTSPIGFPSGQITVPLTFSASAPTVLPGCLIETQVQPGTVPLIGGRLRR